MSGDLHSPWLRHLLAEIESRLEQLSNSVAVLICLALFRPCSFNRCRNFLGGGAAHDGVSPDMTAGYMPARYQSFFAGNDPGIARAQTNPAALTMGIWSAGQNQKLLEQHPNSDHGSIYYDRVNCKAPAPFIIAVVPAFVSVLVFVLAVIPHGFMDYAAGGFDGVVRRGAADRTAIALSGVSVCGVMHNQEFHNYMLGKEPELVNGSEVL